MNITEMNTTEANGSPAMANLGNGNGGITRSGSGTINGVSNGGINLDSFEVQAMRHRVHELANVFTGVMIAGDLLSQHLEGKSLRPYALHICEGSARGCALVREIRSQLLAACGEPEAAPNSISVSVNSHQ